MRFHALLFLASALFAQTADPNGRWEGAVQIPGMEQRLIIDLARAADGKWNGSAILPGLGVKGASLADVSIKGADVSFSVKGALGNPKVTGHLVANDSLTGEFTQSGNTAPFSLQKTGPPQVELPRPATPVTKPLEGEWRGNLDLAGNPLRAKLTLTPGTAGTTAQFIVGNKKDTNLPVSFVTQEGVWLTVEVREFGISYEGRFHPDKNEIEGVFVQSGLEFPLVFHRPSPQ